MELMSIDLLPGPFWRGGVFCFKMERTKALFDGFHEIFVRNLEVMGLNDGRVDDFLE